MMVELAEITLEKGCHDFRSDGVCAVEAIAWLAGEPHNDHPKCLSPILGIFLRNWNDALDSDSRAKLKPFLPRAIDTAGDGHDETRAWMCMDWLVRTCAPAWLYAAGVKGAIALRALPPLMNPGIVEAAQLTIGSAMVAVDAVRDALAVRADAALIAPAGSPARATAGAAAKAAALAAAWGTDRAAWDIVRNVAWDVAWVAAGIAAEDHLNPTKVELQASALELLGRMVSLGEKERARVAA